MIPLNRKNIAALLAAAALALPVAAPAAAYDEICLRQKAGYTTNGISLRRVAEHDPEQIITTINLAPYITAGLRKCMNVARKVQPGEVFTIVQNVNSGPDRRCYNHNGGRTDGALRWPEGGGTMELEGHGHAAGAQCRIVNYRMWEGCGKNQLGGFDQTGCQDWEPDPAGAAVFDYVLSGADLAYARSVLERGADVHARRYNDETPLHAAVRLWRKDHIHLLRQHGASPLRANRAGHTVIRALFENHRDRPDFMEIFQAMMTPDTSASLKNQGARRVFQAARGAINAKLINQGLEFPNGTPGVINIVLADRPDILQFALQNGGDPNAATWSQYTALHHAARRSLSMVQMLLAAGADPNISTNNGWGAPLHWAVHPRYVAEPLQDGARDAMVNDLLKAGADPAAATAANGATPLHYAAQTGAASAVAAMLNRGADPNFADDNGKTALHHAASAGHRQAVDSLLQHGANPALTESYGLTPAQLAERNGHNEIAAALQQ